MKRLAFFAILLIVSESCEKIFLANDPVNSPVSNFEFLWNEAKNKYSYFEYKNVDWDEVYNSYRPLVYEEMSDKELFNVLADMLFELKDGHVNITTPFDRSRNWDWFLNFPPNFNENIVYRNYLGNDYKVTGPLHNQVIGDVLYVYYASFISTISSANIDELMERAEGLKGIIFDIRSNGGGSSANTLALASALTDERIAYGHSRIKNGPGKDDFSPWTELSFSPRSGKRFTGQIVLLCNRSAYSASNMFAQMMKSLPNAVLVGDKTGGGAGVPAFGELPNGWMYRFSATQTTNPQGEHIENGVEVDVRVDMNPEDEANGIDSMLETALDILN